jgi:hypothetical protein
MTFRTGMTACIARIMTAMVHPTAEITTTGATMTMTAMVMEFKIARIVVRTTRAATEHIHKLGGSVLRSGGQVARTQRFLGNDAG